MVNSRLIKLISVWALLVFITSCAPFSSKSTPVRIQEGNLSLILNIDNLRCCEGTLLIAVYNDKNHWMKRTGMVRGRVSFVTLPQQQIEIHGLPAGKYSVAVYQDINFNKRLDRYFGLIPKEPYGFSNNVGKYGPVSFEKASFILKQDREISIKLIDH